MSTRTVLSFLSMSLLLVACTPASPSTDDQSASSSSSVSSQGVIMEPGADGQEDDDDGAAASAGAAASVGVDVGISARVIAVAADNFTFSPNVISVKKGEKITLRLTGTVGNHGFGVPDLGINTAVSEGKTVDVELPTDKTGTFSFRCSVPCGSGHRDMTGTITITE